MCTTPEKCSWNCFCLFLLFWGGSGVVGRGGGAGGCHFNSNGQCLKKVNEAPVYPPVYSTNLCELLVLLLACYKQSVTNRSANPHLVQHPACCIVAADHWLDVGCCCTVQLVILQQSCRPDSKPLLHFNLITVIVLTITIAGY